MRLPSIRHPEDTTTRDDRVTMPSTAAWSKRKVATNLLFHAGLALFAAGVFYFGWVL